MTATDKVTEASKVWNREVFGNIFRRKNRLEARIRGIQNSPSYNSSRGLQKLESKLCRDLDLVLCEEEILWFQKSRRQWVEDGDRNTTFYHCFTVIRRN